LKRALRRTEERLGRASTTMGEDPLRGAGPCKCGNRASSGYHMPVRMPGALPVCPPRSRRFPPPERTFHERSCRCCPDRPVRQYRRLCRQSRLRRLGRGEESGGRGQDQFPEEVRQGRRRDGHQDLQRPGGREEARRRVQVELRHEAREGRDRRAEAVTWAAVPTMPNPQRRHSRRVAQVAHLLGFATRDIESAPPG